MSSKDGFGTSYYGWRHLADGTATATKWVTVSWLPVIPLHRQRLRVLTNFANPELKLRAGRLTVAKFDQVDRYQFLEKLPLSAKEIGTTLCKTYLGLPAIFLLPMLGLVAIFLALQRFGVEVRPETPAFQLFVVGFLLNLLHFLWQVVRAIRRARGWQPTTGTHR